MPKAIVRQVLGSKLLVQFGTETRLIESKPKVRKAEQTRVAGRIGDAFEQWLELAQSRDEEDWEQLALPSSLKDQLRPLMEELRELEEYGDDYEKGASLSKTASIETLRSAVVQLRAMTGPGGLIDLVGEHVEPEIENPFYSAVLKYRKALTAKLDELEKSKGEPEE